MLNLGHARTITDAGIAHLAQLKALEQLIILRAPNITSKGLAHLTALPLKRLTIRHSRLDDIGMASIAAIKTLEHLDVAWSRSVTDVGVSKIASLRRLKTLNIAMAHGVTDKTVAKLAALPLTDINLSSRGCAKSATAMQYSDASLSLLAKLPKIKRVVLYGALHVTAAGVKALRVDGREVLYRGHRD